MMNSEPAPQETMFHTRDKYFKGPRNDQSSYLEIQIIIHGSTPSEWIIRVYDARLRVITPVFIHITPHSHSQSGYPAGSLHLASVFFPFHIIAGSSASKLVTFV